MVKPRKTLAILATTLASIFARVASLVSQVIVGVYLTEAQVGTFAVAIGIMGVTALMRGGGSALYLPTIRPADFDAKAGRMFWWSAMFLTFSASLTVGAITLLPTLSERFPSAALPGLSFSLWLLAAKQLISAPATLGRMRMSVNGQFNALARLDSVQAILRVATTWIMAEQGTGVLALVVPTVMLSVVELIYFTGCGAFKRSDLKWQGESIGSMWRPMKWPLIAAIFNTVQSQINLLVLGAFIEASAMGIFYFAFQLANQPTMLLSSALQNVLAPYLAQARGNAYKEKDEMSRVFAGAMLFVPVTTVATASLFPAIEEILWRGKWAAASHGLYFLCAGATFATVAAILTGPLLGLRRFKAVAAFEMAKTVGTVGGALVGTTLIAMQVPWLQEHADPATIVCAATGITIAITSIAQLVWIMRGFKFSNRVIAGHLTFGPMLATLVAVSAQSIGHSARTSFGLVESRQAGSLMELALVAAIYCVLIVLAMRFTAESTVRDVVSILPLALRQRVSRILQLS